MSRADFALTPAQRHDARAALRLLEGTEISLEEAARRAVAGRRALKRVLVADAVDQFVRSRLSRRAATVGWYESKLRQFGEQFGARHLDDVTRAEIMTWLGSLKLGDATKAAITRALRALWRWGIAHEPQLVAVDVTIGLQTSVSRRGREIEFLTVEECEAIMGAAGEYRSALALLLFAGVRPEELAGQNKPRLLWRHVRTDERLIRIPADVSKTGADRIIEGIPATLWAWLQPGDDGEPVSRGLSRQSIDTAKAAIKRADWPHDGTRHTFATYAVAFAQDAGKVAHWLGHQGNPTMLYRHYRGLATRAEAENFWALRP